MSRMASCEPVVLGEAVAEFEHWLQSCRDNGRTRYSKSAVVRAYESLEYSITLWREFPEARPFWAAKLRDLLAITSAPAMHGGRQPVSANSSQLLLRSNSFVQDSDDNATDASGRNSDARILISSSSAEEDLQPYEDENAEDDAYDADSIIDECVRNVSVDHSNLSGNRLRVGSSCKHYLVKWAGYAASQSTWTPACMCSTGLVQSYVQRLSRSCVAPPPIEIRAPAVPDARMSAAGGVNDDPHPIPASAEELRQRRIAFFQPPPRSIADPVAAPAVPDAPIPAATVPSVPSSNACKKRPRGQVQVYADVGALHPEATIHTLKARIQELNPDCDVRVRGRDRVQQKRDPSIVTETVRLGCKHVAGAHPCQLSIYCDVVHTLQVHILVSSAFIVTLLMVAAATRGDTFPERAVQTFAFVVKPTKVTSSMFISALLAISCAQSVSVSWLYRRYKEKKHPFSLKNKK
jgi:hypothetical protein